MKLVRHFIVECLVRFAYWSGLDELFYRLNIGSKRIIMFHNILPDSLFDGGNVSEFVSNSESDFRFIVREIRKRFAIDTDVGNPATATLTFDDGYLNQFECARKILKEEGNIPAVIFVAGRLIGNKEPRKALLVDLLMLWVSKVPKGIIEFRDGSRLWTWLKDLYQQMGNNDRTLGVDVLRKVDAIYPLQKIFEACDPEYLRLRFTGLSEAQIEELRANGWVVGWHTQNHFPLSKLDSPVIKQEMSPPDKIFKSSVFAYPYGGHGQVDRRCIEAAQEIGYPCAVSAIPYHNELTGRYFIPRMGLQADKYRLHYELSGLRYFMLSGKLLPRIEAWI